MNHRNQTTWRKHYATWSVIPREKQDIKVSYKAEKVILKGRMAQGGFHNNIGGKERILKMTKLNANMPYLDSIERRREGVGALMRAKETN